MSNSTTEAFDGVDILVMPSSHLDLFWLGDYRNCLRRGNEVIASYLDRMKRFPDETFVIDTVIFAEHFMRTRPEYGAAVREFIREGRLEIGSAYIDRWENLVLGESLIRNIQIGSRWLTSELGVAPTMAGHPDLPGLNAQTSQIYAQAGVKYYVTSRKIFQEGRVWRHEAPDGTSLHMLTWPVHYVFAPIDPVQLPPDAESWVEGHSISGADLDARYPMRKIAVSGSAGDLTNEVQFLQRYRRDLRDYVDEYRTAFPNSSVGFGIPADVMGDYLGERVELATVTGALPSVWGVAADEEARFFTRAREAERLLLAAETAAAIASAEGREPLPASASRWEGLHSEDAFFAEKDFAPSGREFEWLWRMHVFTQDHNGGGQDGTLSTFQKRVRQDRLFRYAREVIAHAVEEPSARAGAPGLFSDRLGTSVTRLVIEDTALADRARAVVPAQEITTARGDDATAIAFDAVAGVGVHTLEFTGSLPAARAVQTEDRILIESGERAVAIDRRTGAVVVSDADGREVPLGLHRLNAVPELGDDVTISTGDTQTSATVTGVQLVSDGALASQVRLGLRLLDVEWALLLTVWHGQDQLDVDVFVRWPALERLQVRLPLVDGTRSDLVSYGTPFHASVWDDVPDAAGPLMPDEISTADFAAYREVQHWVAEPVSGLLITTQHPGFHLVDGALSAVLMRTPPSCGDRRMIWENAGANAWSYRLHLGAEGADADVFERADRDWRRPMVVTGAKTAPLLEIVGGAARLSALYPEGDALVGRIVNQSGTTRTVRLRGRAVGGDARLEDLAGNVGAVVSPRDGEIELTLDPWRIQTIRFERTTGR